MKKLLCMIISAVMLCAVLSTVSFAKTADIVHQSVEGTAVIDGVKDEAYANALALPMIQKGLTNGGGKVLEEAMATVYILNDAEWVYVFFEVTDNQLDSTNSNDWEQDSVEIYYMHYNIGTQIRYLLDGTAINDEEETTEAVIVPTDIGYNAEVKFPITDVLNNQIETCVQINQCTDGIRDYTVFIEGHTDGDNAWQRADRDSEYDSWWTLTLAGEHADTREEDARPPMEISKTTYAKLRDTTIGAYLSTQNRVDYSDYQIIGESVYTNVGGTAEFVWTNLNGLMNYDQFSTEDYTVTPFFNIVLGDSAMAQDTQARYHYTYSDITVKAEGYEDVVLSGGEINTIYKPTHNGQYVTGHTSSVDLATLIAVALDINTEELCTYLNKVTEVSGSVTFIAYEGRTKEDLDQFLAELDVEDVALVAEIEPTGTELEEAEALFASEDATFEEKEAALKVITSKVKLAAAKAVNYPKASALVADWTARVDALTLALEEAKPAVTEPPVTEAPETEAPEVEKPNTEAPTVEKGGLNLGLILGIIAAVVAIAIVVVIFVPGKKKK